ncbi:exodeoxyribonuclease III [Candidatus Gracilibacteria bacterium]|nr:exodeoxyribonuclease III [Candidatus Gracilibacteria bacterium]
MKIISWNVNGIRAVERKGELEKFLGIYNPDVFLIQETKAQESQIKPLREKYAEYEQFYECAEKAGYAGTSIWVKNRLRDYETTRSQEGIRFFAGIPGYNDTEGRIARVDIEDWSILGVYFPNGGKSPEAWKEKLVFYEKFLEYVNSLRLQGRKVVWGGDVNCAHEEIDLARPKENKNSIGFLPEERAWVTKVVQNNWSDVFRTLHPDSVAYSWWHLISRARERNVGWRIDYFFLDSAFMPQVKNIAYLNEQMGSDHCPVKLELKKI